MKRLMPTFPIILSVWLCVACTGIFSPGGSGPQDKSTTTTTVAGGNTSATTTTTVGSAQSDRTSPVLGALVRVPAGSFQRDPDSRNVTKVAEFWMSAHEVTWGQYAQVTGLDETWIERPYSDGSDESPATASNWYDAIAFCNLLSISEGLTPVYGVPGVNFYEKPARLVVAKVPLTKTDPNRAAWDNPTVDRSANGYRLPTEAEWMWAAMGADRNNPGMVNSTGYRKAFAGSTGSNAIGDYAVFGYRGTEPGRTSFEGTGRVGNKKPNELGIYDLSGNVFEWCHDWYLMNLPSGLLEEGYCGPSENGATFANVGSPVRVMRGGSWYELAQYATVASREGYQSPWLYGLGSTIGFRIVRK